MVDAMYLNKDQRKLKLQSIIDNLETHATLRTRQRKTKQKAQHTLKKMSSTDPTKTSRATPGAREQHGPHQNFQGDFRCSRAVPTPSNHIGRLQVLVSSTDPTKTSRATPGAREQHGPHQNIQGDSRCSRMVSNSCFLQK